MDLKTRRTIHALPPAINKSMYMHTLQGVPGYYDGKQICFCYHGVPLSKLYVESLDKIRQQQEASRKWRKSMGFGEEIQGVKYGYLRVSRYK